MKNNPEDNESIWFDASKFLPEVGKAVLTYGPLGYVIAKRVNIYGDYCEWEPHVYGKEIDWRGGPPYFWTALAPVPQI
jgi:hypothetical protein